MTATLKLAPADLAAHPARNHGGPRAL